MRNHSKTLSFPALADAALSFRISLSGTFGTAEHRTELQRRLLTHRRAYLPANDAAIAEALLGLSYSLAYGSREDVRETELLLEEAQKILAHYPDYSLMPAQVDHLRGKVNTRLENFQLAISLHEKADLGYVRYHSVSWARAANLVCLAALYRKTRRMDDAVRCERLAEDIYYILEMFSPRNIVG